MHKVVVKQPDGTFVEVPVQDEQPLQVSDSQGQMGQPVHQQPMGQPAVQQPVETNPAFAFIEKLSNIPDQYMGGDEGMAKEEKEFNEQLAKEKKQLDDFAKI